MSKPAPFEPTSARFLADPYAAYARLQKPRARAQPGDPADGPDGLVRLDPPYDGWWVLGHDLVDEVCRRRDAEFVKPGGRRDPPLRPVGITSRLADGLFFMHGERHREVRALLGGAMAAAAEVAPKAAVPLAGRLLARALENGSGRMDLIADYAAPLAMHVFMSLFGIPAPDLNRDPEELAKDGSMIERVVLDLWLHAMLDGHDKMADRRTRLAGGTASLAVRTYLEQRIEELLDPAEPDHHTHQASILALIGRLRTADGKAAPAGLADAEAVNTAAHFALGGYLSTEFLIGTGVANLLRHRAQWDELCEAPNDAALLNGAIDEMLRYDAPFQMADRWVDAETELAGHRIPAGTRVTVVYGAANRDPAKFADPDRFDIHRTNAHEHFGFGHGVHRCIGEALARQVTAVALRTLTATVPWVRLGEVGAWRPDPYFRSLTRVELLLR